MSEKASVSSISSTSLGTEEDRLQTDYLNRYQILELLFKKDKTTVYLVQDKLSKMVYAMIKNRSVGFDCHKNIDLVSSGDDNRMIVNDFVVRVFKEFKYKDYIYQILEYMEG